MCIRDRGAGIATDEIQLQGQAGVGIQKEAITKAQGIRGEAVSYTHLRAHETVLDLVCRLLLEKKKQPDL